MKQLTAAAVLSLAAALLGLLPFSRRDVAELKPVQTLVVETNEGGTVVLTADDNLRGEGPGWEAAVHHMETTCPGYLFLSTAKQVIFVGQASGLVPQVAADPRLRPAADVYLADGSVKPETATAYLKTRESRLTLNEIRTAALQATPFLLPYLQVNEDTLYLREENYDPAVS